ncbi:MAG: hypothetical protein IPM29_18700 [Planctomycetes bacterium]|nr:hypothetical protein [Planctomycetota bacterium]
MRSIRSASGLIVPALLLMLAACGGGASDPDNRGDFLVAQISTGQGQVYPYRMRVLNSVGLPTSQIVNVESRDILERNLTEDNGLLPVATFPDEAILPSGSPGNQFLLIRFTHKLQVESILSGLLANSTTNSGLTTAISVLAYDPNTEQTTVLRGRGFVGGRTYFNRQGVLEQVQAVDLDANGSIEILDPDASGFPRGFSNDAELVSPKSFVFVADSDGDLDTFETFDPQSRDVLIRVIVTNAVRNTNGRVLQGEVCTATTVGTDPNPPDVLGFTTNPRITPGNGQSNVDPTLPIRIEFNKPVQPWDVGRLFSRTNRTPQPGGVSLNVTASAQTFSVTYYADPVSYGDFCNYIVTPAYNLPGDTLVQVNVNATSIHGLTGDELGNNISTTYRTGDGPGIVNAPVCPDAIYVGIGGAVPGVSVIDLNGFGQGTNGLDPDPITGRPTKSPGDTNYARNPNIGQPGVLPSLAVGLTPLDAGSNGALTLVEDTRGNTRLLQAPLVGRVTDIHVGPPLDLIYNNSNVNVYAGGQNQVNPNSGAVTIGNCVTVPPHPNPPKLIFPPPNLSRLIFGEEPTVISTNGPPPPPPPVLAVVPSCVASPVSQLTSGTIQGYYQHAIDGFFTGPQPAPSPPPPPPMFCPYTARQQVGHFLFILDRENRQVLVVNSNRFTVLDSLRFSDPVAITMSPTLGVLAVANFSSSSVSFVNTDPRSAGFLTVVAETRLPNSPSSIKWQPDGEALITVSRDADSLTVLSGRDFTLQKTVSGGLNGPIDIAVTQRYQFTGNTSGVYYAYVLNTNGTVSVFESGPEGVNGTGFNDLIGDVGIVFRRGTRVRLDYQAGLSGFWITHVDEAGVGVVSRVDLTATPRGPLPTQQNSGGFILPPTFRQKEWSVVSTIGGSDPTVPGNQRLSGNSPVDVCVDEMFNNGWFINQNTTFNNLIGRSILGHSSKGAVLIDANGNPVLPMTARFLFVALSDVGAVDVFDLVTRGKVTTISIPGVASLSGYWKQ